MLCSFHIIEGCYDPSICIMIFTIFNNEITCHMQTDELLRKKLIVCGTSNKYIQEYQEQDRVSVL